MSLPSSIDSPAQPSNVPGSLGRRAYVVAAALPVLLVLLLGLVRPPVLSDLNNLVFDFYQRVEPRDWQATTPVRIVDIDDASLARLGQWPWPRTVVADIIAKLGALGAAAVAVDIVFAEPDSTSLEKLIERLPPTPWRVLLEQEIVAQKTNDTVLAEAMTQTRTVLGTILTQGEVPASYPKKSGIASAGDDPKPFLPRFNGAIVPLPELSAAATGLGAVNWLPDRDQVVRRVPLLLAAGDDIVTGLATEALRVAQEASTVVVQSSNASGHPAFGASNGVSAVKIGDLEVPTDRQGEIRVRYSQSEPRRFIPAWKIAAGEGAREEIEGRIIVIGSSAAVLGDRRATPIEPSVPGVEIHAQVLEQLLTSTVLERPDWLPGAELVIAIVLALLVAALLPLVPTFAGVLAALAIVAGIVLTSWQAFSHSDFLIDPILPSLAVVATFLSCVSWLYWHEQRQRRYVRAAFGRYVSPAVVARLAEDPSKLVLGGEKRELTVMFCDIRAFTAIAERFDPQRLTQFMNEYLTAMSDIVMAERGTIDKYVGDAIMAFWNAPLDDRDHAAQAARAALRMSERLTELNARWRDGAYPELGEEVRFGIGLATGDCLVGNLGSAHRFDYSVLGDSVNIASRLQDATKFYRAGILADAATHKRSPQLAWLEIDHARMKGKAEITRVFALAGDVQLKADQAFAAFSSLHGQMLEAYRRADFDSASSLAEQAQQAAPASLRDFYDAFAGRCRALAASKPADWTPVTVFPDIE